MVSGLASSMVDRGFESRSDSKDYELAFVVSSISTSIALRSAIKDWLVRIKDNVSERHVYYGLLLQ